jgi:DNA-binding MarR family transcriptional regulator
MSIDKDIKQEKFRNEHQRLIINLMFTHNWMIEQIKEIVEKEGITMQQFNILRILRGSQVPISTLQIRERMLDKMSDCSRIVDRLVIKGLAKKTISRNDKRLVDVTITEKGKKLLLNLDKQEENFDEIVGVLAPPEAKSLNILLDKIRQSK